MVSLEPDSVGGSVSRAVLKVSHAASRRFQAWFVASLTFSPTRP